jgi:2-polyprenyl-3-methyl-5-hydroxy-6-metoxy-1,4-benzoquinol methylase
VTAYKLEQDKVDLFAQKMMGIINSGALTLMTSIGHRTGLFDRLAALPPSTSAEIAEATGLRERYVREWLNAMVTGGVIEYDPDGQKYMLPQEHAACLTRAAGSNNMATTTQFFATLGAVEDRVVESFRNGGGVFYSEFPRFHEVMAEESNQTVTAGLFEHVLPLIRDVAAALEKGIAVLDVGCGRGSAIIALAEAFPNSRFTGYDFSEEAIAFAGERASQKGLTNIRFEVKDAATLDGSTRFDLITAFDAIHDQAAPDKVLGGISSALAEGGTFLMQDIAGSSHVHKNLEHPLATFFYTISCMHCMTVSLATGGAGLGTMWGEEKAVEMLGQAGFANVEVKRLPHDIINNWYVAKKSLKG